MGTSSADCQQNEADKVERRSVLYQRYPINHDNAGDCIYITDNNGRKMYYDIPHGKLDFSETIWIKCEYTIDPHEIHHRAVQQTKKQKIRKHDTLQG